ncbi:MAG: tetratricopeptide repeat protein [Verrucomicrobia bacterium]|nr:tetratricopeptide repeat protein [Verrucomicrobiota bacterium]
MSQLKYLFSLTLCLLMAFSGCQRVPDKIEPTLSFAVQDKYLLSLPSPFPPLSEEEKAQDWGREIVIGFGFAHELDLYQAITAFKRAEFLIPPQEKKRALEVQYEILLCYYMGKKWNDVIYTFEHSQLRYANQDFPALHDLLLIMYESYEHEGMEQQAERFLEVIHHNYPEEGQKLALSSALVEGNLPLVEAFAEAPPDKPYLDNFLSDYQNRKKSVSTAQTLNAFLPGAGYLYLGQRQSATTAFFLNGLFIAASTYFFLDGNIAAGIIFTSFEAGWYFGGIYGAGLEAKEYNERLYESMATPMMNRERLFPALMLNYAF